MRCKDIKLMQTNMIYLELFCKVNSDIAKVQIDISIIQ